MLCMLCIFFYVSLHLYVVTGLCFDILCVYCSILCWLIVMIATSLCRDCKCSSLNDALTTVSSTSRATSVYSAETASSTSPHPPPQRTGNPPPSRSCLSQSIMPWRCPLHALREESRTLLCVMHSTIVATRIEVIVGMYLPCRVMWCRVFVFLMCVSCGSVRRDLIAVARQAVCEVVQPQRTPNLQIQRLLSGQCFVSPHHHFHLDFPVASSLQGNDHRYGIIL